MWGSSPPFSPYLFILGRSPQSTVLGALLCEVCPVLDGCRMSSPCEGWYLFPLPDTFPLFLSLAALGQGKGAEITPVYQP